MADTEDMTKFGKHALLLNLDELRGMTIFGRHDRIWKTCPYIEFGRNLGYNNVGNLWYHIHIWLWKMCNPFRWWKCDPSPSQKFLFDNYILSRNTCRVIFQSQNLTRTPSQWSLYSITSRGAKLHVGSFQR